MDRLLDGWDITPVSDYLDMAAKHMPRFSMEVAVSAPLLRFVRPCMEPVGNGWMTTDSEVLSYDLWKDYPEMEDLTRLIHQSKVLHRTDQSCDWIDKLIYYWNYMAKQKLPRGKDFTEACVLQDFWEVMSVRSQLCSITTP